MRLFDAIARQDLGALRAELAEGVDLHCVNTLGETLIVAAHRALRSSDASVAWDIMAAIFDAGYQLTETEACLVAPLCSQHQRCTSRSMGLEFESPLRDAVGLIREIRASFFLDYWHTDEEISNSARQFIYQHRLEIRLGLI